MEEFDIFRCSSCEFVFTQDHPEENELSGYYESDNYVSHSDRAAGFSNRIYRLARMIMLVRKRSITEKVSGIRKGNLLDIGCGTGYFAGTMKDAGWNVTGIEPNEKAKESGSLKFGIDIINPDKIKHLPDGSFDCITMWHVLEHFGDPFAYAAEVKRLLKPGGVCITALPNCSSFDAEHYRNRWAAFDVPRHLWHFTPVSFNRFAEKTGLIVTGISGLPLDVFYISILSEKAMGHVLGFITGILKGTWFAAGSALNKKKTSSLVYFLKSSSIQ